MMGVSSHHGTGVGSLVWFLGTGLGDSPFRMVGEGASVSSGHYSRYHRQGGLTNKDLFPRGSGGWKSEIMVLTALFLLSSCGISVSIYNALHWTKVHVPACLIQDSVLGWELGCWVTVFLRCFKAPCLTQRFSEALP